MVGLMIFIGLCVLGFLYWNATRQIDSAKEVLNSRGFPEEAKYPTFSAETFKPTGVPISTADAKRLYVEAMVAIGYFDKTDSADYAKWFGEAMKDKEEELKDEFANEKECLKDEILYTKDEIRDLKKSLAAAKTDEERKGIAQEIADMEQRLKNSLDIIEEQRATLDAFRKDKRAFLVDYANREIHHG